MRTATRDRSADSDLRITQATAAAPAIHRTRPASRDFAAEPWTEGQLTGRGHGHGGVAFTALVAARPFGVLRHQGRAEGIGKHP
jgi:hypothetical protein